eukprot:COSAG04_NODE_392_length_15152_cov_5.265993_1_plen_76_part_00
MKAMLCSGPDREGYDACPCCGTRALEPEPVPVREPEPELEPEAEPVPEPEPEPVTEGRGQRAAWRSRQGWWGGPG